MQRAEVAVEADTQEGREEIEEREQETDNTQRIIATTAHYLVQVIG